MIVFVEYLVLKARDRTYVLDREIELHRRKRRELENLLSDCRSTLEVVTGESEDDESLTEEEQKKMLEDLKERLQSGRRG